MVTSMLRRISCWTCRWREKHRHRRHHPVMTVMLSKWAVRTFLPRRKKKKRDLEKSPYFDKSKKRKAMFDENDYNCIGHMAVQEPDSSWRNVVVFREKSDPDRVVIWFGKNEFEERWSKAFDEKSVNLRDGDVLSKDFVPTTDLSKNELLIPARTNQNIQERWFGHGTMARWKLLPATVMSSSKKDGTYRSVWWWWGRKLCASGWCSFGEFRATTRFLQEESKSPRLSCWTTVMNRISNLKMLVRSRITNLMRTWRNLQRRRRRARKEGSESYVHRW